jgi:hypothetical protein
MTQKNPAIDGVLGSVRQLGFVVHDLDLALEYWTKTLGVGPFFTIRKITPEPWRYRGEPSSAPCVSLALANSGKVQIEIIQQRDGRLAATRARSKPRPRAGR